MAQIPPSRNIGQYWWWPLLGWLLGAALTFGVLHVTASLLKGCSGHALLGLALPFLLGPGGLGLMAYGYLRQRPALGFLALGLVMASLWPALGLGVRQMAELRAGGCGGGYFILQQQGRPMSHSLVLKQGDELRLSGKIAGYQAAQVPDTFTLRLSNPYPQISARLSSKQVKVGEAFELMINTSDTLPTNVYTIKLDAVAGNGDLNTSKSASQRLELTVHR